MSTWLNGRLKNDALPHHELCPTEAQAIAALTKLLEFHRKKGRTVTEGWVGGELGYEVTDAGECMAVHWLSPSGPDPDR